MARLEKSSLLFFALLAACSSEGDEADKQSQESAAAACECALDWEVDNVVPCIAAPTISNPALVYSTRPDTPGDGDKDENGDSLPDCNPYVGFPQPTPAEPWSAQRVKSSCGGQVNLCIALKHGVADKASADDCVITEHCFDVDYQTANQALELAPLPGWSAQDAACTNAYFNDGGYVEFRSTGDLGCGENGESVRRVQMCPNSCTKNSSAPECKNCSTNRLNSSF